MLKILSVLVDRSSPLEYPVSSAQALPPVGGMVRVYVRAVVTLDSFGSVRRAVFGAGGVASALAVRAFGGSCRPFVASMYLGCVGASGAALPSSCVLSAPPSGAVGFGYAFHLLLPAGAVGAALAALGAA